MQRLVSTVALLGLLVGAARPCFGLNVSGNSAVNGKQCDGQPDADRPPPPGPEAAVQPVVGSEEPAIETVTVEIDDRSTLHELPERYGGTNFVALWNDTGASPGTVSAFSRMGAEFLRFPGGVPCQWYDWEFPLASGWTAVTPQHAYDLAKAAGAALILQTNVATDDPAKKFDSSGRHAAKWVVAARKAGAQVAFWEVGNEPEVDAPKEIKSQNDQAKIYEWYNRKFEEQARAIKSVDPGSRVMGPASTNTWYWWAKGNLEKFMKAHGNRGGTGLVDAVSIHWYPEGHKGSWEEKRGVAQGWTKCMEILTAAIRKHDARALPLYVTEWNWAGGQDNTSAMEMRNALGCADIIGMFLRTGVAGHTHFCLQRANKNWGVLAMKKDALPENEPTPTYFALKMASLLGRNVLGTKCGVDEANVMSAYASRGDDGSLQVMLINKTGNPLSVALAFSKRRPQGKKVEIFELRGVSGGILDRKAVYNGVESPSPATGDLPGPRAVKWTEETRQEVAPHSLLVLSFRR